MLGIAWAFVAHTDSHFEPDTLIRFVRAYQKVQPLSIGELWAIAITLRIVLVENLRRATHRILSARAARQDADDMADRLLGVNGEPADPGALLDRYGDHPTLNRSFVVQLVQRLRDQDPIVTPSLVWLEERLAVQGKTVDTAVRDEHQRQGASNVTVRNIITSMRLISDLEWSDFFESVSLVDEVLRAGSDFAQMDFATRNLYRSSIEELARGSQHTRARDRARGAGCCRCGSARQRDPGYHLIAAGRRAFEDQQSAIGPHRAPAWPLDDAARCRPLPRRDLSDCGTRWSPCRCFPPAARSSVAGLLRCSGFWLCYQHSTPEWPWSMAPSLVGLAPRFCLAWRYAKAFHHHCGPW